MKEAGYCPSNPDFAMMALSTRSSMSVKECFIAGGLSACLRCGCIWKRRQNTIMGVRVVIAIIAILAAMLLPALSAARERARQSNCQSKWKQVALSFQMYTHDNDHPMLLYDSTINGVKKDDNGPVQQLCQYIANEPFGNLNSRTAKQVQSYFICPSYAGTAIAANDWWRTTLGFNSDLIWYGNYAKWNKDGKTTDHIKGLLAGKNDLSATMLFGDTLNTQNRMYRSNWNTEKAEILRHGGQCNIAYFDGHVGALTEQGFHRDAPSDTKADNPRNLLWGLYQYR